MTARYEWVETRSGRKYVRTVVPNKPLKAAKAVVEEPQTETLAPEPALIVEEAPKPKRGRPKAKVPADE